MSTNGIPQYWFARQQRHVKRVQKVLDMNSDLVLRQDLSEHELKYQFTFNRQTYICYIHTKYVSVVYRGYPNFPISQEFFFKKFNEMFDAIRPNSDIYRQNWFKFQ
jgi:hypothetical protein